MRLFSIDFQTYIVLNTYPPHNVFFVYIIKRASGMFSLPKKTVISNANVVAAILPKKS